METLFIKFGGGLALLFGFGQIVRRIQPDNLLLSLAFSSIGIWLILFTINISAYESNTILPFIMLLCALVFGPAAYIYFRYITGSPLNQLRRAMQVHSITAILVGIVLVILFFSPWFGIETRYLYSIKAIYVAGYIILFGLRIQEAPAATRKAEYAKRLWHVNTVAHVMLLVACMVFLYGITGTLPLAWTAGWVATLILMYIFIIAQRYPDLILYFVKHTKKSNSKKKRTKTLLTNVNLTYIKKELRVLMFEERLYRDEHLRLNDLAMRLRMNPHQLSEFLNKHLNTNYYSYINGLRVQEAEEILISNPAKKITTIAYYVGFNSISSFHTAFHKKNGMTPSEFRKTTPTSTI